jgi:putative hydrolase of the HAD superfamily
MIKAITFDLWNTLLEDKHFTTHRVEIIHEIINETTPRSTEEIREAYRSAARAYRKEWEEDHTQMTMEDRITHIVDILDVEPPPEAVHRITERLQRCFLDDPPTLKEGVRGTLEALNGRYRLGIISDTGVTPGTVIREYLDAKGILHHFGSTIFSDETGYAKPHPTQFMRALQELDAEPHEAIHVGDLLRTDIAGAKAVGMKAVWVRTDGKTVPRHTTPDYTINQLDQVLAIPELNPH